MVLHYDPRVLEYAGISTQQNELLKQQGADAALGLVKDADGRLRVVSALKSDYSAAKGSGTLTQVVFQKRSEITGALPVSLYDLSLADDNLVVDRIATNGHGTTQASKPASQLENSLEQNAPNPFNPSTTIAFTLAQAGPVDLVIYNVLGQEVRRLVSGELMVAGAHRVVWDGRDALGQAVSSGIYLYEMQVGEFRRMQRMLMLK